MITAPLKNSGCRWILLTDVVITAEIPMDEIALKGSEILEIANKFGVSWPALQAQIGVREAENKFDDSIEMNALRALHIILQDADPRA